jgi:hypothetical protein
MEEESAEKDTTDSNSGGIDRAMDDADLPKSTINNESTIKNVTSRPGTILSGHYIASVCKPGGTCDAIYDSNVQSISHTKFLSILAL